MENKICILRPWEGEGIRDLLGWTRFARKRKNVNKLLHWGWGLDFFTK